MAGGVKVPLRARRWSWSGLLVGIRSVRRNTLFGEASAWTQATDPPCRETFPVRTGLSGLRGDPKWFPVGVSAGRDYAVQCQSSDEEVLEVSEPVCRGFAPCCAVNGD